MNKLPENSPEINSLSINFNRGQEPISAAKDQLSVSKGHSYSMEKEDDFENIHPQEIIKNSYHEVNPSHLEQVEFSPHSDLNNQNDNAPLEDRIDLVRRRSIDVEQPADIGQPVENEDENFTDEVKDRDSGSEAIQSVEQQSETEAVESETEAVESEAEANESENISQRAAQTNTQATNLAMASEETNQQSATLQEKGDARAAQGAEKVSVAGQHGAEHSQLYDSMINKLRQNCNVEEEALRKDFDHAKVLGMESKEQIHDYILAFLQKHQGVNIFNLVNGVKVPIPNALLTQLAQALTDIVYEYCKTYGKLSQKNEPSKQVGSNRDTRNRQIIQTKHFSRVSLQADTQQKTPSYINKLGLAFLENTAIQNERRQKDVREKREAEALQQNYEIRKAEVSKSDLKRDIRKTEIEHGQTQKAEISKEITITSLFQLNQRGIEG